MSCGSPHKEIAHHFPPYYKNDWLGASAPSQLFYAKIFTSRLFRLVFTALL